MVIIPHLWDNTNVGYNDANAIKLMIQGHYCQVLNLTRTGCTEFNPTTD